MKELDDDDIECDDVVPPEWFDDGEVKYRHYGKWQKPTFQGGGRVGGNNEQSIILNYT